MPQKNHRFENDPRSVQELIAAALPGLYTDGYNEPIAILHYKGNQEVFDAAKVLCASEDAAKRGLGAVILGQLGWDPPAFWDESVEVLISLLHDRDEEVITAAAYAIGHRRHPAGIPHLLSLANHVNPEIRLGVVSGLSGLDDERAINGLIDLSQDDDEDVRDWATFGLGSMTDLDSDAIRTALVARLTESNPEIRGEAFIGLANRKDARVIQPILDELQGEFFGGWAVEAAETLADPIFYAHLIALKDCLLADNTDEYFIDSVDDAIRACKPTELNQL